MKITKTETGELWEFPVMPLIAWGDQTITKMWIDKNGNEVFETETIKPGEKIILDLP